MTIQIHRYIPDTEIEACATHLLHQYSRQQKSILTAPVPVEDIIDLGVNLPIVYEPIPDHEGTPVLAKLAVRGQPQPTVEIIVNEEKQQFFEDHKGTQQYSLAHELGHFILHIDHGNLYTLLLPDTNEQDVVLCRKFTAAEHEQITHDERKRIAQRMEFQAERFAAYLLMPQDLLRNACATMDLCQWQNLYQLKDTFQVSITALTRRLKELHLVMVTPDKKLVPYRDPLATQSRSLWE
ncbi:ImmA/IrrE family metallo-endopeptidase [Ktedonobacteria bacterium brp13]|nr:ImmA/IrrE family metallo-endopeptidase [Ktedonobacteria bacterium brp13]